MWSMKFSHTCHLALKNYTIDYCVKEVNKTEDSVELSVMAVALHNDVIIPYVEAFKKSWIKANKSGYL